MEKGIDLRVKELKEELIKNINSSNMPPVIIKYVLKELLQEIEKLELLAIEKQSQELKGENDEKN